MKSSEIYFGLTGHYKYIEKLSFLYYRINYDFILFETGLCLLQIKENQYKNWIILKIALIYVFYMLRSIFDFLGLKKNKQVGKKV